MKKSTKILVNAFFNGFSHYSAVLPYNLNWMIENFKPIESFLEKNPLIIVDIGARWGNVDEIATLKKYTTWYGFEADPEEVQRLKKDPPTCFKKFEIFPYYIGDKNGKINFNLYKNKALSSSLPPNPRYQKTFGGTEFDIEDTVDMECMTLDSVIKNNNLEYPDLIKLDTQGTELNILLNSPESLSNSLLIEVEVEFIEMYQGQYLFHDVLKFMYDNGFELLYLNRVFGSRGEYKGVAKGQITFGDALFGRREDRLETLNLVKIAKYIILLINYGHLDFAFSLYKQYPSIKDLIPDIEAFFIINHRGKIFSLKKGVLMQLDKIICLLLYLRKTNQIECDSDRSYPIR